MPAAAEKTALTDRFLRALKPVARGERRRTIWDLKQGLAVQIGTKGHPTFFVVRRMPGAKLPTWRKLGEYPAMSLADARDAAGAAYTALGAGHDPKEIAAAKRRAEAEAKQKEVDNSFGAVAERFIALYKVTPTKRAGNQPPRRAADVAAVIRRELVRAWETRPITEITKRDIVQTIAGIVSRGGSAAPDGSRRASGGRYAARTAFANARLVFGWAFRKEMIPADPCAIIDLDADLHVAPDPRERVLSNDEVPPVWRAAEATAYPYGPLVKLLLLTGARLREVAEARWSEIDPDAATLTVPTTRAKTKVAAVVPLTPTALAIVASLPRHNGGDFLFSTTGGRRPISGFSKFREKFNRTLATVLEKEQHPELKPFTLHDLRRTVRTGLSSLRVLPVVAEMVIGHAQQGIARVYDVHRYDKEKREALRKWERHLVGLVAPKPASPAPAKRRVARGNVVPMRRRARA